MGVCEGTPHGVPAFADVPPDKLPEIPDSDGVDNGVNGAGE